MKGVRVSGRKNNTLYTEKYQKHIPCRFAYKVVCVDDKFSKPVVVYRGKNAINRFIEVILEEYDYCNDYLKLTKTFPYLKGYDSHLIVQKDR